MSVDVSVIICTASRARDLRDTLTSLSGVRQPGEVELIVVDNRSTDDTARVMKEAAAHFPFEVRYLFESEPGKYAALNAGIKQSRGRVIAATDDDARFEPDWLERGVEGLARYDCHFVGGRALPLWGGAKPEWLREREPLHAKVIGLLDHGTEVREFGNRIGWPLGVNVFYRRDVFDRVGTFNNSLGRKAGTLRNQAQREWHLRARAAGARGYYLPDMVVHHQVAPERLQKRYFRRWMYWHGISRAIMFRQTGLDMEEPDQGTPSRIRERQVGGVPVRMFRKAARSLRSLVWHRATGSTATAFDFELWLCFFAGAVQQRWIDRNLPVVNTPAYGTASPIDTSRATSPPSL